MQLFAPEKDLINRQGMSFQDKIRMGFTHQTVTKLAQPAGAKIILVVDIKYVRKNKILLSFLWTQ
jgi:hypothetical protein